MSIKVVYFQRKPRSHGNFSIEILFDTIRASLPASIDSIKAISRFESKGLSKRLYNIYEAYTRQGDVNHVTGDVHFLTYLLKKRKTVLTIHDCAFMHHPSRVARFILRTFWLSIPIAKSTVITVVSEATKGELLKYIHCKPDKIKVIPNCISPKFKPSPKKSNAAKPTLLQIGTAQNKNLERLLEAIKDIPCQLVIIGKLTKEHKNKLGLYNIDYENAYNLSEEEIIERYQQCDILTFVSTYEGFGMPIVEANAIGRPVVTSNILSLPEIAGNAACLVDPFDVGSIREGIIRIIEDAPYREQLIRNGFKNKRIYDAVRVAQMYSQIYKQITYQSPD